MTDKNYPPPCRNYLQPLYLFVTLYACAQRDYIVPDVFNAKPFGQIRLSSIMVSL